MKFNDEILKTISLVIILCIMASMSCIGISAKVQPSATSYNYSNDDITKLYSDAVEFNGNYYVFYYGVEQTWTQSKEFCESIGGHLAVITTDAERQFIESEIIKQNNNASYFIGGKKSLNGVWDWINGEDWGYSNWRSDQPDNSGGDQNYLRITYSPQYNWNCEWDDINASGDTNIPNGFICEWDNDSPVNIYEHNGHYYSAINLKITWHDAKSFCESLGGHLATVSDQAENDFISKLATDRQKYFLGATDEDNEGTWKWVDGSKWSYTNWAASQPDNVTKFGGKYHVEEGEDYLELSDSLSVWNDTVADISRWDSTSDAATSGFICEWDSLGAVQHLNMLGDTDNDNQVSVIDATAIQLYVAQLQTFDSKQIKASDTDNDGYVSVMDATQIQLFVASLIDKL